MLGRGTKKTESTKMSDLIKEIRNCKTKAEERAIINKEKASIRQQLTVNFTCFKIDILLFSINCIFFFLNDCHGDAFFHMIVHAIKYMCIFF